jgi:6,7-dimethyl-8-ribityllumazine synthase
LTYALRSGVALDAVGFQYTKNVPDNFTRIKGTLDGRELRIGIVVSRWNREITDDLLSGALRALAACSVPSEHITILEVPGALEIPIAAGKLASMQYDRSRTMDAIIAIGCVIKGETAHFEHVSRLALDGIARVSRKYAIPVTCGILTTYDVAQAEARSGPDDANVGSQAALAAIEMVNALRSNALEGEDIIF